MTNPIYYIMNLPPKDQIGLAEYLERLAIVLREQAKAAERIELGREKLRRHRNKIKDMRSLVKSRLWQGFSFERTVSMIHAETGIDIEIIASWAKKEAEKIRLERRNRAIMQKVAGGWTNAMIAEKYGLAEKYVARLISKTRHNANQP